MAHRVTKKANSTDKVSRLFPARMRQHLVLGNFRTGRDIVALRRFIGLSQDRCALAVGISVHTLRNWERGGRRSESPALALLRIAARLPRNHSTECVNSTWPKALMSVTASITSGSTRPLLLLSGLAAPATLLHFRRTRPAVVAGAWVLWYLANAAG